MSQSDTRDGRRIKAHNVTEGDTVFMGINAHGLASELNGAEYDKSIHQAGITGTVTEAPDERTRELMADTGRVMADFTVEDDDGNSYTWNVDNGYVLGYHPSLERRSDVGRFGGFYEPADE